MADKNKPTEAGFYWARSAADYKWWNLIVHVQGTPPYLSYIAWDMAKDNLIQGCDPAGIYFGPKINAPYRPDWKV